MSRRYRHVGNRAWRDRSLVEVSGRFYLMACGGGLNVYTNSIYFYMKDTDWFCLQETAYDNSQKYKEGKYIIELIHMIKDNGWS